MADREVAVRRPKRWDQPFSETMTPADVARLRGMPPFSQMDPTRFPKAIGLDELLANDARILEFQAGDLVVREGDYGHSAFLILEGAVRVSLEALPPAMLGRRASHKKSLLRQIAQVFLPAQHPEQRNRTGGFFGSAVAARDHGTATRVFLQDVPGVLDAYQTVELTVGQFFGEQAAMARTPRTATIFASQAAKLLEIRWQGLRDLMRHAPELKSHIDQLYRANSLEPHLRETPILASISPKSIPKIARQTLFETYGDFEWQTDYLKLRQQSTDDWIGGEPIIGEEGSYADGLLLIRSGFARLSHRYGDGHRTLAYLGKGRTFGLDELIYRWKKQRDIPWQSSLRAVGYVDILRIPSPVVEEFILPRIPKEEIQASIDRIDLELKRRTAAHTIVADKPRGTIPTDLLEFILDQRLMNGTQTMIIDLQRCTRCDDCVRACAATHDNNPRFIRSGPIHDQLQFAHACMHCVDPVCMIGCPTGAIGRDPGTGTIVINDLSCIGCGICAKSCPYDNITMVEIRDRHGGIVRDDASLKPLTKATKCDLCIDQWGGPACQRACPHDALIRIDMNNIPRLAAWTNGR
jgi:Fe-S-cluster-containing dehydrogenase component/CRP-like cAMP-binding protein